MDQACLRVLGFKVTEPHALSVFRSLRGFRAHGDSFFVSCVVHEERTASLRGTVKEGKLVLHCFSCKAGAKAILDALGLPWSSLWSDGRLPTQQERVSQREAKDCFSWRDSELSRLGMIVQARYDVIKCVTSRQMNKLSGVILAGCYRGLSALEWEYEHLAGMKTREEIGAFKIMLAS